MRRLLPFYPFFDRSGIGIEKKKKDKNKKGEKRS
jgi:hypothetical protein